MPYLETYRVIAVNPPYPYLYVQRARPVDPTFPTRFPESEVGGDVGGDLAGGEIEAGATQEGASQILGGEEVSYGTAPRPLAPPPPGRLHRLHFPYNNPRLFGKIAVPPNPFYLRSNGTPTGTALSLISLCVCVCV